MKGVLYMPKSIINPNDIINHKYGKLTVRSYVGVKYSGRNRNHMYVCKCDCGTENVITSRAMLLKGDKTSCGCAHKDAGKAIKENLIGQKFGRWTVIDEAPNRVSASGKTRSIMWKCKCDCGTVKDVGARALKTGMSTSCGCLQKERVSEALTDNLMGQRFGHLVVIGRNGSHCSSADGKSAKHAIWTCKCDCGNVVDVLGFSLKNGDTTSCGCSKESKYESYTEQYLQSCGYVLKKDYFREKTFRNFKGLGGQSLRFDFYVKLRTGEKILIECQGEQHFRPFEWYGGQEYFERLQKHDAMKREFAKDHGYRLIELNYKTVLYSDVEQFLKNNFVN